jgi:hypothetical protein
MNPRADSAARLSPAGNPFGMLACLLALKIRCLTNTSRVGAGPPVTGLTRAAKFS